MSSNLHLVDDKGRPLPKRVVEQVHRVAPAIAARFAPQCDPAELSNSVEHEAQKIACVEHGKSDDFLGRLTWRGLVNAAISLVRKSKRKREDFLSPEALNNLTGATHNDPETELINAERREALLVTLATLSDREQEYLRLREQEFGDEEIAVYMKLSKNTLAQLKHRLKLKLIAKGILPK